MTAAVAVAHGGDVVLGVDSCSTAPGDMTIDNAEKKPMVFVLDGHPDLVMVFAGQASIQSEAAYGWTPPAPTGPDPVGYLRACASSLRAHFTTEPLWSLSKRDNHLDGHFIAAWNGVAVEISCDFGVVRPRGGEVAIGSGRDFVLGALAATRGRPAEDRVRIALEAAAEHQQDVAPPFSIRWAGR